MKNKTQKRKQRRISGGSKGNEVSRLLVTVYAEGLPPLAGGPGGSFKGEIYTSVNGIKIVVHQIIYGDSRDPRATETMLPYTGTIPPSAIEYYKLVFKNKIYGHNGSQEMFETLDKLTKLIILTHSPIVKCETDLEACNNKNREINNENQTLIDKIAKIPQAFSN